MNTFRGGTVSISGSATSFARNACDMLANGPMTVSNVAQGTNPVAAMTAAVTRSSSQGIE